MKMWYEFLRRKPFELESSVLFTRGAGHPTCRCWILVLCIYGYLQTKVPDYIRLLPDEFRMLCQLFTKLFIECWDMVGFSIFSHRKFPEMGQILGNFLRFKTWTLDWHPATLSILGERMRRARRWSLWIVSSTVAAGQGTFIRSPKGRVTQHVKQATKIFLKKNVEVKKYKCCRFMMCV